MNQTIEDVSASETNTSKAEEKKDLIKYLRGLEKGQNRAALAHLRRGLGKPPGLAMEMFPYLGQFLSEETFPAEEDSVFITAALFAYYPDAPGDIGNLGASMRRLSDKENKNKTGGEQVSKSVERRFVALLNAEKEDLPYYLRQIIGLLKSNEIAVNWYQLFNDIQFWNDKRNVQRRWAEKFWGNYKTKKDKNKF